MQSRTALLALCALLAWSTASQATASPTNYGISTDGLTDVRFTVEAPLDSIVGISRALSGNVVFDPDTLAFSEARMMIDPRSFQTGIGLRDEDLRDQFFEVQRYPEISMALQKLSRPSALALAPGSRLQSDLNALFTLHGVARSFVFPVALERSADGRTISMHGSFNVALADYNIKRPQRLFLKLGEVARVDVRATFIAAQPTPPSGSSVATRATLPAPNAAPNDKPMPAAAHPVVRKRLPRALLAKARKPSEIHFDYNYDTPEGRGERLLSDASIGGTGNAVTCTACHSTQDERFGFVEAGSVHPSRTLFDVSHRPDLWQGFAKTAGKASSLCAKMYMLKPVGLDEGKQADLEAYLNKISPDDVVPALDYRVLTLTKQTPLAHPTAGDSKRGQRLTQRDCESCHGIGEMRPPLTPGLYEPDYLVQRIRWLPGTDAHQMPPMYLDRLTDSELRDIVTYLAGDESERIFKRDRSSGASRAAAAVKASAEAPPINPRVQ